MRITSIGHASYLIETADLVILADPMFGDTYWDGVAEPCPARTVVPARLPRIDVLFLSHHHTDHFDIETLASLPSRPRRVLCPRDPLITNALSVLGFDGISALDDGMSLRYGSTTLTLTPSALRLPEHGLLVSDPSGRLWNQVDTRMDPAWVPVLHADQRPVDVHLAAFDPFNPHGVFENGVVSFPYGIYKDILEVVRAVGARLIVPSSCGAAFVGELAFLNRYGFSLPHRRFVEDARAMLPASQCELLAPGDVIEITAEGVHIERQASPFVATTDPSRALFDQFDPTSAIPELRDDNPERVARVELEDTVARVIARTNQALAELPAERLAPLRAWRVKVQLTVVFPDHVRSWSCDVEDAVPALRPSQVAGTYVLRTTASGLHGLDTGALWDRFLLSGYRAFHTAYRIELGALSAPTVRLPGEPRGDDDLPDPFHFFFDLWKLTPKAWIDRRLELVTRRALERKQA